MNRSVVVKDEDLTSDEKSMVAKAKRILKLFEKKCSRASMSRQDGFAYIGKIKRALGMPDSRLRFEHIGIDGEDVLVHRMSVR